MTFSMLGRSPDGDVPEWVIIGLADRRWSPHL